MESKVKSMGHPIHPMMVTFPLGLLTTAAVFDIVHLSGIYGINPLRNACSWISRGAWRTSMISPLTSSIQISGFLSTIDGIVQSGAIGYMSKRSRICLDFACIVLELRPK